MYQWSICSANSCYRQFEYSIYCVLDKTRNAIQRDIWTTCVLNTQHTQHSTCAAICIAFHWNKCELGVFCISTALDFASLGDFVKRIILCAYRRDVQISNRQVYGTQWLHLSYNTYTLYICITLHTILELCHWWPFIPIICGCKHLLV